MAEMESMNKQRVTGRTRDLVIALDRRILWFARHWLLVFNIFVFLYVGTPFLAPLLMRAGWTAPARLIYLAYGSACHQLGYRSWYFFGENLYYPRAVFQQRTGIDPNDLWASRAFIGDEQMGYKVAYCQRDVAIYGAIFLGGLIYGLPFVRRRVRPLHWAAWIAVGIFPIALDGVSQLLGNYPYNTLALFSWLPSRESTPLLRTFTGILFGLMNVWLAYPYVEDSMAGVRDELTDKLTRAGVL